MAALGSELIRHDLVYGNLASRCAAAPLIFPKPGPDRLTFTVNLHPVNRFTVTLQYPMPILEEELTKLADLKFFANFDFVYSHW